MVTPKVTELSRASAHRRQVAYVRASLLRGITYGGAASGTRTSSLWSIPLGDLTRSRTTT